MWESLADLFLSQAERYGPRPLYRFFRDGRWDSYTWRDAEGEVQEIGLGFVALGVHKGDRVAILAANGVEWCLVDWASICVGALTVPLYPASSVSQILHILAHSEAKLLVVESRARWQKLRKSLAGRVATVVLLEGLEEEGPDDSQEGCVETLSLERLRELGREYAARHPGAFVQLAASLRPSDDLTIIYTSGTTGEPKGVLTTHGHYLFAVQAALEAVPCKEEDTTLQFLPLAHSFGRLEHFVVVARGCVCAFSRSIDTLASDLQAVRPTILFSVPRIYENAYQRVRMRVRSAGWLHGLVFRWAVSIGGRFHEKNRKGLRIPFWLRLCHGLLDHLALRKVREAFGGNVRLTLSGGAPLSPPIAEFFQSAGICVLEGYGLTETSTVTHVNRVDRYRNGTVGLPVNGVECRIAADGEVLIRGPNVFKAYYKDAHATREAVDSEGWFHTGDVGEIDREGFLRITDRKKDLIVTSGGKKVAPQMIENLLKQDPLISQAMVLGDRDRHVVALLTLDRDAVTAWARSEGLQIDSDKALASHPEVVAYVRKRVRDHNKKLAPFEAIRNFRILSEDFSAQGGELTATLKLRRQIVMERYRDVLDELGRKPKGEF